MKSLVTSLLALALISPISAARSAPTVQAVAIEAALRHHIEILADDAMAGRKPGTDGGDRAARYIAGQMAAIGLEPVGRDRGWYLPVALIERAPRSARTEWRIGNRQLTFPATDQYWTGDDAAMGIAAAPVIFGGHGIDDDLSGVHNFAGANLSGAIVLIHPGKPEGLDKAPGFAARVAAILARGAAAVVLIARPNDSWDAFTANARAGRTVLDQDDAKPAINGGLSARAWRAIAAAAGLDPERLLEEAGHRDFRFRSLGVASLNVTTRIRRYTSWNVAGRLPGTVGEESLLYLAHWDHLGICRPAGDADRICNGAVDNASGVAMLLEVARGLAAMPRSRRDILFVATTAEEMGLLGAKALAEDPPVPLARIAAVLNFDTVAVAPAGEPISIIGRGLTPLDPIIDEAARRSGRRIDATTARNNFLQRQDGWIFSMKGVPSVMVGGAFTDEALLDGYMGGAYHQPNDDIGRPLILGGAAEDTVFQIGLAHILADPARFPLRASGN